MNESQVNQGSNHIEGNTDKTINYNSKLITNVVPRTKIKISSNDFNTNLCWHCQTFLSLGPLLTLCQLCYFIQSYLVGHYDISYSQQVDLVKSIYKDRFILLDQYGPQYFKAEYLKQHEDYLTILLEKRFNKNRKSNSNNMNPANINSIMDKSNIHAANQWHNDREQKYNAEFNKANQY